MYPWLGQAPQGVQGSNGLPWWMQRGNSGMQQPGSFLPGLSGMSGYGGMPMGGGGMPGLPMGMGQGQGQGQGQSMGLDWSNPQGALEQLRQRFMQGPAMDRSGLSSLWSQQPTSTSMGPGGWQTSVTPQSPLGGLLGKIGGGLGKLFG